MMKLVVLASIVVALVFAPPAEAHILTYSKAKQAAQRKADSIAGQPTRVRSILRTGLHSYYAAAQWRYKDKLGELGAVGATVKCSVSLLVRFRSRRSFGLKVVVDSKTCS